MLDTARIYSFLYVLFTISTSLFLCLKNAYGENLVPAISVRGISIDEGSLNAEVGLYGKATEGNLEISSSQEGANDSGIRFYPAARKAALNVGIIVDNSALCVQGLEAWWARMASQLPQMVASQSRLTLITYTGHSIELLAQGIGLGSLGNYRLQCDAKSTSGSADRAINRFLSADTGSNLKRTVWIITSGNLRLSSETTGLLKQAGIPVEAFVYNPALAEILPTISEDPLRALGRDLFHATALDLKSHHLAAIFYNVSASVPYALNNKTAMTRFSAKKDGEVLGSIETKLIYPAVSSNFLLYTLLFVVLGIIAVVLYIRYARAKQRTGASYTPAYLTGLWTSVDEATRDKYKSLEIKPSTLDLGTHFRSAIPLIRPLGGRRACLARITRTLSPSSPGAECAYKILPFQPPGYSPVLLNGAVLAAPRNLAHGDRIQLGSTQLTFHCREEN